MKTDKNDASQKMSTLSECINTAIKNGYVENFTVEEDYLISEKGNRFRPNEVSIPNFYRFEGYSDPEDNAILYLLETTNGTKGTVVDSYGREADENIASFIKEVQDIRKEGAEKPA